MTDPDRQTVARGSAEPNAYRVRAEDGEAGWQVSVVDERGDVVFSRACSDERDAATFASTVRQHVSWLSPAKFRQYYRIGEPADVAAGE